MRTIAKSRLAKSAAWPRELKRRFMMTVQSQSFDLGSTPTLVTHVVASLDKALYDDYLCLVALNKQQIKW